MSYHVYLFPELTTAEADKISILDYENKNLILLEPRLEMELNTIDHFTFKMPPNHLYYDLPKVLASTIEVYEDNECIWFGRVISITLDYYRQKEIYCEGPLGWFNDSVASYRAYSGNTLTDLFRFLVQDHNDMVPSKRDLVVGNTSTIPVMTIKKQINNETIYDLLMNVCLDAIGGYFIFRKNGPFYYIDWRIEIPSSNKCNQPIRFGLNLVDFRANLDATEIFTCLFPIGDTLTVNNDETKGDIIPEGSPRIGTPLTLAYHYGSNIIRSSLADTYGQIVKPMQFSGVKSSTQLYDLGREYLQNALYDHLTFELTATDLNHFTDAQNQNYQPFKIGQIVHCESAPHGLNADFPLLKMTIELDSAVKQVSLGTAPRKEMSQILNEDIVEKAQQNFIFQLDGNDVKNFVVNFVTSLIDGDDND